MSSTNKVCMEWIHPFTSIIAGPTSCGKTVFVTKFLTHIKNMVDKEIKQIVWCYGVSQPIHEDIQKMINVPIRFIEGVPTLNDVAPETVDIPTRLVIIDDLMRESNGQVVDIFSKGSHHRNLSVLFLTQNIFYQGKGARDMSLNTHYIVLFKSPRDKTQIVHLARQMCPENTKFLHEAYLNATAEPHTYLLFDMKQSTPEAFRYRTNIFPGEEQCVYIPKKPCKVISSFVHSSL